MSQEGPEKRRDVYKNIFEDCLSVLIPKYGACFVNIACMYCFVDMSFEASMAVNIRIVFAHLPD